jgi:hypothetical protein
LGGENRARVFALGRRRFQLHNGKVGTDLQRGIRTRAYNSLRGQHPKVPEDDFKAVIRALLNTPPTPASTIEGKRTRKAGARKPGPKKTDLVELKAR